VEKNVEKAKGSEYCPKALYRIARRAQIKNVIEDALSLN
jgi:hypothetical protein